MEIVLDINIIIKTKNIMLYKSFKNKGLKKQSLKISKSTNCCEVSQASNEIMLDRFYNGKRIDFPFA